MESAEWKCLGQVQGLAWKTEFHQEIRTRKRYCLGTRLLTLLGKVQIETYMPRV